MSGLTPCKSGGGAISLMYISKILPWLGGVVNAMSKTKAISFFMNKKGVPIVRYTCK